MFTGGASSFAVPLFLATAVVLITHMTVKRRRRVTGEYKPAPSYLKIFAVVALMTYGVMYFVTKPGGSGGYTLSGGYGGGGASTSLSGAPATPQAPLTMDELMRCIDMSDPPF